MKSLLISGDRSGAGKTSVTLAIAGLLAKESSVQTYKVAMDYIDTSYLAGVTGRPCYNLDTFVQTPEETAGLFAYGAKGAEYGIVEGVRGLYEGVDALTDVGSTASVAKLFDLPVVLVVNARSITRSAAALVKGFAAFDPDVRISGVILNNVMGDRHISKAKQAIEHYCGIPVLGAVPRRPEMELAMRHLGLVPFREGSDNSEFFERIDFITDVIGEYVDMDAVRSVAKERSFPENDVSRMLSSEPASETRIAVAYDEAFNFYYGELAAVLRSLGADVVYFSPMHDRLPDADGYIFGGGYPELFSKELEANDSMREAVLETAANDVPMYAECGGLMYLTRSLTLERGWQGRESELAAEMCGVFAGDTRMPVKKALGYVVGTANVAGRSFPIRGHEFHYSGVVMDDCVKYAYRLDRGVGIASGRDGAIVHKTLGSYAHLMPVSSRELLGSFFDLV
ncbi:Ni-sirohydrochlorin a,c-diamide synthase [Methanorbis rubei]|uniref:Cobyrinate a,c-diamide synthase n=1 Tax=Methanorbis rubei TaxID=3028300 RepID=A0AAE4MI46_9EURY|nr:Cobyrinate a,c-diamide synthase [Methanocorpusculaceae archaeon Cs1]